jgi:hypothetical protein
MDMRGKELDDLFRSSLDELEIQPSAQVWAGITKQLDADKRKRSLVSFLSIAAGIILALVIGVLFMPKQVKVKNQNQLVNRVVKDVAPVIKNTPVTVQPNKKGAESVITPDNHLVAIKIEKANRKTAEDNAKRKKLNEQKVVPKTMATPDALLATRGDDLASAVIADDIQNEITAKPVTHDLSLAANKLQPTVSLAQTNDKAAKARAKKRRIHSVGDLFNVVIAAVDKRKDKVIEFSNTDEDDAVITGINLGIIKVKKEK